MADTLLDVRGITKRFAGVTAVNEVSFALREREVVGLIGPNGAGKTTMINLLTGYARPDVGEVYFLGDNSTMWPTHRRVHAGLTRTFQSPMIFPSLTVLENIQAAAFSSLDVSPWDQTFRTSRWQDASEQTRSEALELAEFTSLDHLGHHVAGDLPYGHRKVLGIALGLATRPRALLMDEPTAGLSPGERAEVGELLGRIRERGASTLVVEHDMKLIMSVCDRIVVLNYGNKIAEGVPDVVRNDPEVIRAYLGGSG